MSAVINKDSGGSLSIFNAYNNRHLGRAVKMDEERGDNSGWMNVISNSSVIIRRLEKYISYDDLKACRLVCQAFNQSIVQESSFSSRTRLIIKEETFRSGIFFRLSFTLKNVDVHLFKKNKLQRLNNPRVYEEPLESVYPCFSSVESLKLHSEKLKLENFALAHPHVWRLIRATESLKEFQLSTCDVNLFLNVEYPQQVIEKMKEVFGLVLIPLHLADIGGQLIVRSADTVTSLKILEPHLWAKFSDADTNYICDTHFPKLRELRIRAKDDQAVEISNFLAAHGKQLDSLGIRILGAFPCDIIDGIRQEASKKIKKLTIATNAFDHSRPRNLAFLEDLQELESFKLRFIFSKTYDPNCDSMTEVFSFLPTKNLRKLSLIRLSTPPNENLDHLKIKALSGLKYLALDWCGEAVNDETINAIFKHMTQLEYLSIKHARKCGVRGFTGTENVEDPTPDPEKVAASNLTKLKHLVLQHCGLDDHIIKVALKFKDLEILDIRINHKVTSRSCLVAVTQNPSLKVLRTDTFCDKIKMKTLRRLNARFRSHETDHAIDDDQDSSVNEDIGSDVDGEYAKKCHRSKMSSDHSDYGMDDIEAEPEDDYDFDPHPEDYDLEMAPEEYDFVNPEDYDYYFMHDENDGNVADDEYDAFED